MGDTSNSSKSLSELNMNPIHLQNCPISIKLSETNYLIWSQQVLATVRGYGLEHHLEGDKSQPPQFILDDKTKERTLNPNFKIWNRQDQLLSAWIQSSLTEDVMIIIVGLSSMSDIWKALEVNFASQSKAKLMQYKLQLQTLKKDGLSMRDYLGKIKTCCDLLGSAGHHVKDDDQILHILSRLGNEYDPVMVTITAQTDSWNLQDVYALLLGFEARLETARITSVNTEGSQPSAHQVSQAPHSNTNHYNGRGRGG